MLPSNKWNNTDFEALYSGRFTWISKIGKLEAILSWLKILKFFLKNKKLLSVKVLEFSKLKQVLMNKVLEFDENLLNWTYFQTQWKSCKAAIPGIRSPGRFSMSIGLPVTVTHLHKTYRTVHRWLIGIFGNLFISLRRQGL